MSYFDETMRISDELDRGIWAGIQYRNADAAIKAALADLAGDRCDEHLTAEDLVTEAIKSDWLAGPHNNEPTHEYYVEGIVELAHEVLEV
jgi:hypothetical protein